MRRLPKPILEVRNVFTTCISTFREPLKSRLIGCTDAVVEASNIYDQEGNNGTLNSFIPHALVNGDVTAGEMGRVYTEKMVPIDSPGREFYDEIKLKPKYGICPLCSQRIATTLDHHLPKADYPILAVTPLNLVPACKDCNIDKRTHIPTRPDDVTLHPYYDNVENEVWLKCEVMQTSPASVRFFVECPAGWDDVLKNRVQNHFSVLHLAILYGSHAAQEIADCRLRLEELHDNGGTESVKQHLVDTARSRADSNMNSWGAALYRSLGESDWFCSGGFHFND